MSSLLMYDSEEEISYEDYVENCLINDLKPESEESHAFYSYINEEKQWRLDDFFYMLMDSEANKDQVVIDGVLGQWYGPKEIEPVVEEDLVSAIKRCISTGEQFLIFYEEDTKCISVTTIHHDGRNHFYIYKISKNGLKAVEKAEKNNEHLLLKSYMVKKFQKKEFIWL